MQSLRLGIKLTSPMSAKPIVQVMRLGTKQWLNTKVKTMSSSLSPQVLSALQFVRKKQGLIYLGQKSKSIKWRSTRFKLLRRLQSAKHPLREVNRLKLVISYGRPAATTKAPNPLWKKDWSLIVVPSSSLRVNQICQPSHLSLSMTQSQLLWICCSRTIAS